MRVKGFEPSTIGLDSELLMRVKGFEPSQALSYWILSPARLTTPAHPLKKSNLRLIINLTKSKKILIKQYL